MNETNFMTRRRYLEYCGLGVGLSALQVTSLFAGLTVAGKEGLKLAMCDWSMGRTNVSALELAKRIGLDGMQISMGSEEENLPLRRSDVQRAYLDASREYKVAIASLALTVLNNVPLMNEPRAGYWLADTIRTAGAMKAPVILLPFFGKGLLRETNTEDMRRVIDVLRQAAPEAEKAGVILGLESYLSAETLLDIIEKVGSRAVQVYYDVFNADHESYDVLKEIRMLGRKHICEVHFKEGPALLGDTGKIDWPAVVAELKGIRYDGWIVLETQSPKDVLTDTQKNMDYVQTLFDTTPAKNG